MIILGIHYKIPRKKKARMKRKYKSFRDHEAAAVNGLELPLF